MKAVITAAGKGVRLFPITKEFPKEMMLIYSKPTKGRKDCSSFVTIYL